MEEHFKKNWDWLTEHCDKMIKKSNSTYKTGDILPEYYLYCYEKKLKFDSQTDFRKYSSRYLYNTINVFTKVEGFSKKSFVNKYKVKEYGDITNLIHYEISEKSLQKNNNLNESRIEEIDKCFLSLSPHEKNLYRLRFIEGLSITEMHQVFTDSKLSISRSSIYLMVMELKNKIKDYVDRNI